MSSALKITSWIGLALTLLPALMVFAGTMEFATHKTLMLVGTGLWFFTRPFTVS